MAQAGRKRMTQAGRKRPAQSGREWPAPAAVRSALRAGRQHTGQILGEGMPPTGRDKVLQAGGHRVT
jgi:hypothetical protein